MIAFFPLVSCAVIFCLFRSSLFINVEIFPFKGRSTPQTNAKYFLNIYANAEVFTKLPELPKKIEFVTVIAGIGDISTDSASLNLAWENSRIEMPFTVSTDEKTMASIKETMKGNPGHRDYYSAASYYLTTGRDLKKAEKWITKAVKEKEYYFYFRTKAEIHAGLKKFKLAIEAANKSIKLAEKRGTKNLISLNKKSIEEWSRR